MPHLTAAETPNHIKQIMNKCVVLEAIIILRFFWKKSWGIIRRNNSTPTKSLSFQIMFLSIWAVLNLTPTMGRINGYPPTASHDPAHHQSSQIHVLTKSMFFKRLSQCYPMVKRETQKEILYDPFPPSIAKQSIQCGAPKLKLASKKHTNSIVVRS
jgi:hypothetical protein